MAQILDQYGRPFDTSSLRQPQTARSVQLQREFQGHPARGLTPAKLASLLLEAEEGWLTAQAELGEDMEERDGHIFAELQKRKQAILGLEWDIVPPMDASAKEKADANTLKMRFEEQLDMADVVQDATAAILHAYACQEITWARDGSGWQIERLEYQPPGWFTVDQATRRELRFRALGLVDGEPLQPWGWIAHIHKAKSGYLGRAGLVRVLAWPYLFKNFAAQDLAEFLRIYGLPTKIGHYPAGATPSERNTLLAALQSIGHNAAGIVPEGMRLEFLAAATGAVDPFEFGLGYWDRMESKIILGQALSTETGPNGNRSLGEVGNEIRKEYKLSDGRQIEKTLSRDLIFPWGSLNGLIRDPQRAPRFKFLIREREDLTAYTQAVVSLAGIGLPIAVAEVQERLQFRAPEAGEPILGKPAAVPPTAAASRQQADDCPVCAAAAEGAAPDALDHLRELALEGWETTLQPMTQPLLAALDSAVAQGETLAQFRARLPALLEQMDIGPATEAVARAGFVARVAGEVGADIG